MTEATDNERSAVRVRGLKKAFGAQTVLNGINLDVPAGSTLAVLGRSGSGKSVLLKLLIGLRPSDAGEIEIGSKRLATLSTRELLELRKGIGFLFQQAALYDSMTVEDNVAFPLRRHAKLTDEERLARVRELLSRVGMVKASKKLPGEISGGMRKRVGLARALALDPWLMLLDEPTAGLDPITASEINELIRELQSERNISSLVVTHDMRSVRAVADRVAFINEGTVVIEGTLEDLHNSDDLVVSKFVRESGEV